MTQTIDTEFLLRFNLIKFQVNRRARSQNQTSGQGQILMYLLTNANPDFWIQLKGLNAGQPLKKPIPNCIGVTTDKKVLDPHFFFYVVHYLFINRKFEPYIKGSVIPYIRNKDIHTVITSHFSKS